jgi:hypothetical protein
MKRFFLDTYVIVDFLADRKPFAEAAGLEIPKTQIILFRFNLTINTIEYQC